MIYFIADTHFGHRNIIRSCNRPFSSVEEMDAALIRNWNSRVKQHDTVYILGDMFFRSEDPEAILKKLKGKKKLYIGNHDASWMNKFDSSKYFESIDTMSQGTDGEHAMTLCHFPMMSWTHPSRAYMVHGHIHNNIHMDYWPLIKSNELMLNAGVEINNYMPATFREMVVNNKLFKASN